VNGEEMASTSEEKKEQEGKKKPEQTKNFIAELTKMTAYASQAMEAQNAILESGALQALAQNAKMFQEMQKALVTSQIVIALDTFAGQHAELMKSIQAPWEEARRLSLQMKDICDTVTRANQMIAKSVPMQEVTLELQSIPSRNETLVRSLLREIELLEFNLAEREKIISAKDSEIKQLRELLENKRKKLKEQYVT
jgi:hypothetical protein